MPFKGFSPGRQRTIPLPAAFFTELLPHVHHVGALQVILFAFRALHQKEGNYRYLIQRDFERDEALQQALGADFGAALAESLDEAVKVGALLRILVEVDDRTETLFFLNSPRGRAAHKQIELGRWQPGWDDWPVEILPERPNVYQFYEENIGPLTPHIADELRHAEKDYPPSWVEDAVKQAVEQNKRSWSYIRAILERWKKEGKNFYGSTPQDHTRPLPRLAGQTPDDFDAEFE
jgi:DNA replication protein